MTRLLLVLAAVALVVAGCGTSAPTPGHPADRLLGRVELDRVLASSGTATTGPERVSDAPIPCAPDGDCRPLFLRGEAAFPAGYEQYTEVYYPTGSNNAGVGQSLVRYGTAGRSRAAYDRIVTDLLATRDRHLSGQDRDGDRAAWLWLSDAPTMPIGPFRTAYAIRLVGDTVVTAVLRAPDTRAVRDIVGRIPVGS
ncbi:hypothetical protein [Gordonia sp. (in: high G+C Gram-positive bacteria)]|uniref:hypothetical protein n=1 Tax=Gordonia sp. (in: high G+C Gram-positive bacteria) TaxID=84139 RepID=UPI0039E6FA99